MTLMSLEDNFCDIIKKARLGQSQSVSAVAQQSEITEQDIQILEKGIRAPNQTEVLALGSTLGLRSQPLIDIANNGWEPEPSPEWIRKQSVVITIMGDIGGYAVKGYLLFDDKTLETVMIDTGYNAKEMLSTIKQRNLKLTAICLTHGHADHAGGLDQILAECPVPVYLGEGDFDLLPWKPSHDHVTTPKDQETIRVGNLNLDVLATPGHTPGGLCYRMRRQQEELCFVGDTLFAGSVGRSNPFSLYSSHLRSVREVVLQLPEEAILLPGHGPATTVREERNHNPFA
jgi:glyoxylase-like metal-dependent hydrolase (beta-lactamase superfamily II)